MHKHITNEIYQKPFRQKALMHKVLVMHNSKVGIKLDCRQQGQNVILNSALEKCSDELFRKPSKTSDLELFRVKIIFKSAKQF